MNTFDNGTIYSARCAVHGLHSEVVIIAFCTLYPVFCTLYSVLCALRPVLCALCPVFCALCSVLCALRPAPCALCPVTMQINKIKNRFNNFLFINLQVISCLKQ